MEAYFDNSATTRVFPEVAELVFAGKWNKREKNGGEDIPRQGADER